MYAGLIVAFFLLQCSFFDHFRLAEIVPNLLMILTASIAIINGSLEGCLVGFVSGLILDITFGPYIGMYAFGYMLGGYLVGITNRIFYKEDITFPILMIAAADFFYGFYMYIFGFLTRGRLGFLYYLRRIILPEAVYTVIAAIFLYRLILFLIEHIDKKGSENLIA
jgi:rod shape-determining protein MreD